MADAQNSQPNEGVAKTPFFSKTFHFNVWSMAAAYAVLPFLPQWITSKKGAEMAIAAWFTIGNMVLRYTWGKVLSVDWRHINAKREVKTAPNQPVVIIGNVPNSVSVAPSVLGDAGVHDSGNDSGHPTDK